MPRLLTQLPGKLRSRRSIKRILILTSWIFLLHEFYSLLTHREDNLALKASKVILKRLDRRKIDHVLPPHPIRTRLDQARARWQTKLQSQSVSYVQFKSKYRSKYKVEPPDGMREWFRVVSADGVLLVDEFDEMMKSLEVFRSMTPEELTRRTLAVASMPTFSLLNVSGNHAFFYGQNYRGDGQHYSRENYGPGIERVEGLASMMQRHISRIPEGLLFAVSELAEPRVIVPWQDHPHVLQSFDEATSLSASQLLVKKDYNLRLKTPDLDKLLPTPNFRETGSTWELYAKSCPPESSARKRLLRLKSAATIKQGSNPAQTSFQLRHLQDSNKSSLSQSKMGKVKLGLSKRRLSSDQTVSNLTQQPSLDLVTSAIERQVDTLPSTISSSINDMDPTGGSPKGFNDIDGLMGSHEFEFVDLGYRGLTHDSLCKDSELHQIQGAFYSDWRGLPALYPVFSPSKIDGYSDILIPSNFYYGDDARYSFQSNETISWEDKHNKLFWRGKTTGGGNSPPRHQMQYQRHRFVRLAQSVSKNMKSLLVPRSMTGFIHHVKHSLAELNDAWLDIGFTGYTGCGDPDICVLTEQMFKLKKPVPLRQMAKFKTILDLDGMAFSGRFVALMSMGSGVLKATIFRDALTDWIEPWVHYIPLSVGYQELYNLLAYFLPLPNSDELKSQEEIKKMHWLKKWLLKKHSGPGGLVGFEGDNQLRQIAEDGLKWSQNVGNKPDIEAYVYRLALEWARLLGVSSDEGIDPEEESEIEEYERSLSSQSQLTTTEVEEADGSSD